MKRRCELDKYWPTLWGPLREYSHQSCPYQTKIGASSYSCLAQLLAWAAPKRGEEVLSSWGRTQRSWQRGCPLTVLPSITSIRYARLQNLSEELKAVDIIYSWMLSQEQLLLFAVRLIQEVIGETWDFLDFFLFLLASFSISGNVFPNAHLSTHCSDLFKIFYNY